LHWHRRRLRAAKQVSNRQPDHKADYRHRVHLFSLPNGSARSLLDCFIRHSLFLLTFCAFLIQSSIKDSSNSRTPHATLRSAKLNSIQAASSTLRGGIPSTASNEIGDARLFPQAQRNLPDMVLIEA